MNTKCRRRRQDNAEEDSDDEEPMPVSLIEQSDDYYERPVHDFDLPSQNSNGVFVDLGDDDHCTGVVRTNRYGWIGSPNFYE